MPTQSDYDTQKRILMEAQGWWFATNNDAGGTDTGKSQGHVHVTSCLPEWRTNDTANKITSRYLTVHVRVDIQDHQQILNGARPRRYPPQKRSTG